MDGEKSNQSINQNTFQQR